MPFRFLLALSCLFSTTFAANLTDYSDYQIIPTWAKPAFEALLGNGVISGTAQKELNPNNTINRAEFTKILLEATDQDLIDPRPNSFLDVHPQHWFYTYTETAKSLGWIDGYPDGTFRPGNTINRAEIAKLINKAFDITVPSSKNDKNWYDGQVQALTDNNLLPYSVGQNAFNPSRAPSRAEAFEQMHRAMEFKAKGSETTTSEPETQTATPSTETTDGYDVPVNFSAPIPVAASAGNLDIKRSPSQTKSINVIRGQKNVTVSKLQITASSGDIQVTGLQFRRIGNGNINDFSTLWLEVDNQSITSQIKPSDDLVALNFVSPLTIKNNHITTVNLKADIASSATIGASERFVLYLPDWINANTNEKIGLFPLGGSNVEIK